MLDLSHRYAAPSDEAIELRAFTHGLMPTTVPHMLDKFAEDWRQCGVDAWNSVPNHWTNNDEAQVGWWNLPTFLGDAFIAPLLGANDGTCVLQPNLHWSMQCVLSSPEIWEHGSTVVVTENAFPSVLHSVQQWAQMLDYTIRIARADSGGQVPVKSITAQIDDSTALVVLSHVGFTTGALRPDEELLAIRQATTSHQALFMVDGYHAAATMPLDVKELGVDLYAGGLLKEASGSSGNAFLYIRPALDLTPRTAGWFSDAEPFAFNTSPTPHPSVRRRFLGGTIAVAPMYHAVEGLRILFDAGLNNVRKDSLQKTGYCIDRCQKEGIPVHSPTRAKRRSAMVILPVAEAERLSAYLRTHKIYTDSRQNKYLRLAPFVWNTTDQLEQTFDVLIKALHSRAYLEEDTPSQPGPVT